LFAGVNKVNNLCPCGSHQDYQQCCGIYITHQKFPETPEALMRSRYTAYSQANMNYIQETMRNPAALNFNAENSRQWASQVEWLGLKIISAPSVKPGTNIGFVEFIASFSQNNQRQIIHERSEFQLMENRWFYVAGITPKVNANAPCPCGSQKKFKRCCNS
jgi:SEC-C motif-containing protein